jgi:hypothetical protein
MHRGESRGCPVDPLKLAGVKTKPERKRRLPDVANRRMRKDPHGLRFGNVMRSLVGRQKAASMFRLASEFAKVHGLRSPTKRGRIASAERMLRRHMHGVRPRPAVAWSIGESLRLAGIAWCSGIIGLFAAGYFADIVGVLWCRKLISRDDQERLLDLVLVAPIATKLLACASDEELFDALSPEQVVLSDEYQQPVTASNDSATRYNDLSTYENECREACVLLESTVQTLNHAWKHWEQTKKDPNRIQLSRTFPHPVYAAARHFARTPIRCAIAIANGALHQQWF